MVTPSLLSAKAGGPAVNRVLRLDGQTAFLQVPDSKSLHSFTNAITIEVWFKATAFPAEDGDVYSFVRKNIEEGRENFYLRLCIIRGKPCVQFNPGGTVGTLQVPYEFAADRWYHLAGVYNGLMMAIFVNGEAAKGQFAVGQMRIDDSDLMIGKGDPTWSSGEHFHGDLDEIRLWNVARSRDEIRAALDKPLTGKEQGLVGYWTFDDGTAKDRSPNGNDGKLDAKAQVTEAPRVATAAPEAPKKAAP
jgi:hypothetical protein